MTSPAPSPPVPVRTLRTDLAWALPGGLALTLFAHVFALPCEAGAHVWWASGALAALLATAPRRRWGTLALAAFAAFAAGLALTGDAPALAIARACAYAAEGAAGGWLAQRLLARTQGATSPLAFALLLLALTLAPPALGATLAAALPGPGGYATRWFATWSGDSFGMLGQFPLVLALRREPVARFDARQTATTLLLVMLVVIVTLLAFATLPRPFAFSSLVLGATSLVAGPRAILLLVWVCMVSASGALLHNYPPPPGFGLGWLQLNVFLPVMAIVAPILVLSVALQRLHQSRLVLEESHARFHHLYDRAPVMLQSLDEDGRTIEVNAQWLATLGYDSADAVRGLPFERFLAPEERAAAASRWHLRLGAASGRKLHVRLHTSDGHVIHALASSATAPDDPEAPRGVVLALEDVSVELAMRAEMERERDQLAALNSATSDLCVFLDRELRYRNVNRAFERYWNVARDAVIGRRPGAVVGQELFATEIAAPLARALAGEPTDLQVAIDFPAGPRVMEVALAPAFDAGGAPAGVVATLHDVTELVGATRELRLLVEELQHANEGLEQFARIVSHDLREPLNTIAQFSALIEHDFGATLPADATRYFGLMGQASTRMKAMLDDVLQFARLERLPPVALDAVPLERVFVDLRALLHARLTRTGAELAVHAPLPSVMGQSGLVDLLFQNLLTDAMRHSAPGSRPRIDVSAQRVGALVIVTVSDDGVGIPADELERIFAPFHRLQSYRPTEDSGLGLAICRRVATALGGRIWAESESCRGRRFNVALQAV